MKLLAAQLVASCVNKPQLTEAKYLRPTDEKGSHFDTTTKDAQKGQQQDIQGAQTSYKIKEWYKIQMPVQKASDGFHLDQGPLAASTGLDAKAAQVQKHEKAAHAAIIGYARFDIMQTPLRFGDWNKRKLELAEAKRLAESFVVNGCQRFNAKHFMPLIIKKEYCKEGTYANNPDLEEQLPLLTLTADIPRKYIIRAASGQHRLKALREWLDIKKTEHAAVKRQLEKIQKKPQDALTEEDTKRHNSELKAHVDGLEKLLSLDGQWGVALYDEGMCQSIHYTSNVHAKHRG